MEDNKSMTVKKTVKSGITFGSALERVWKKSEIVYFNQINMEARHKNPR